MLPADAVVAEFAQNVPVAGRGAAEPGRSPEAEQGLSRDELAQFRRAIARMTSNLDRITR